MFFKLCYLFTFITSILNILGVTALSWWTVFMPSVIALTIGIIIIAITLICAFIASK